MRRPLSACALGAVLSITLSAQPAGTSTFSEVLLQPSALPATGGALGLSVTISDTAGVQSAWVEVRYPDGNGSKTDLQRQGTNLSKAVWTTTVTIDRNWQESDQFLTLIFSTKNVLGKYSRSAGTPVRQAALPPDRPRIAVTSMPRYGTSETISGIVYNARPVDYAAAILILVPGWGLVSKPYCSSILTGLNQFGRFSQAYATGGNDGAAVWLAAYLVPKNTRLDCINASGPATPYENAAAGRDGGFRDTYFPGKLVQFGGSDWQAKSTVVRADPGSNFFSSDSVSVDGQGMHFKVMRCHDPSKADPNARAWCAAEARLLRPAGYGTYTATLTGRLGKMAGDIAGGLFVYGDQVSYSHREIDLEFWQDSRTSTSTSM